MFRKMVPALLGLAVIVSPAFAGRYNKKLSVGERAPAFSGIPAFAGDKETTINLADIKEDVVVLCFSANHCPVVRLYEDRMIDFVKSMDGKSVKFVSVCVEDRPEDRLPAIKDYIKEKGVNYTYGFDESQKIGREYGATNTPQFFVLDKARMIRYMGALDNSQKEDKVTKHYLKDAVEAVLKGETVEVAETRPVGCGISIRRTK